jgi:purine-binding chemotaxis protein CheW
MLSASENRADAAGLAPVHPDGPGRQSLLLVRAGAGLCAVPLDHVIEVMRALPVKPVTNAPGYVCGLSIVRGEAIPVVDLGLLVGGEATERRRLVTVRTGERTIGLAATDVLGVQSVPADALKELPPLLQEAGNDTIAAIGTADAELLFLLRATRVIPRDLLDQLVGEAAQP